MLFANMLEPYVCVFLLYDLTVSQQVDIQRWACKSCHLSMKRVL